MVSIKMKISNLVHTMSFCDIFHKVNTTFLPPWCLICKFLLVMNMVIMLTIVKTFWFYLNVLTVTTNRVQQLLNITCMVLILYWQFRIFLLQCLNGCLNLSNNLSYAVTQYTINYLTSSADVVMLSRLAHTISYCKLKYKYQKVSNVARYSHLLPRLSMNC
jgi:hypothetical protein